MHAGHWAWQRHRADHHVGAQRSYARSDVNQLYNLRGPTTSPRPPCDRCAAAAGQTTHDAASLYLSLSSQSADDCDDDDDDDWIFVAQQRGPAVWTRCSNRRRCQLMPPGTPIH